MEVIEARSLLRPLHSPPLRKREGEGRANGTARTEKNSPEIGPSNFPFLCIRAPFWLSVSLSLSISPFSPTPAPLKTNPAHLSVSTISLWALATAYPPSSPALRSFWKIMISDNAHSSPLPSTPLPNHPSMRTATTKELSE